MNNKFRPFWFDQALKQEGEPQANPLTENISADVCIIGGGYTGLWTAFELKERQPDLDIVIIDKDLCGYGASGCNGGCVLTLATKFLSLSKFYGKEEAKRLVIESEKAVDHLENFTKILTQLNKSLTQLFKEGFSKQEIDRIKNQYISSKIYEKETIESFSFALGHSFAQTGEIHCEEQFIKEMKNASQSEVNKALLNVFSQNMHALFYLGLHNLL